MKIFRIFTVSLFVFFLLGIRFPAFQGDLIAQSNSNYESLHELFFEWRKFEKPPLLNGAPDYTKSQFRKRQSNFKRIEKKLHAIDTTGWSQSQKVDWKFIRAEMNGYDFNRRILRSWERDPAFYQTIWMYQSDVPAHEGPVNHALLEYWQYSFPLKEYEKMKFLNELRLIPSLLDQAKINLTGNARDLWIAGIRNFYNQKKNMEVIEKTLSKYYDQVNDASLFVALVDAQNANDNFIEWLEEESPQKNGPSGIGKENYTWYQKNVHLVPLSWEEEVQLLQRE